MSTYEFLFQDGEQETPGDNKASPASSQRLSSTPCKGDIQRHTHVISQEDQDEEEKETAWNQYLQLET